MKKILLMISMLGLVGCATQAVIPSKAIQAPSDRVFMYQTPSEDADAVLIVVRDSGYLGSGCNAGVYLNNKRAASLKPGEKVIFNLSPGEWNVATKGEGRFCLSDAVPVGSDINLNKAQKKAVRLYADPSGNVDVKSLPLQ